MQNLEEELKSEIGGRFLQGVLALLMPIDELNARALRDAMNVRNKKKNDLL